MTMENQAAVTDYDLFYWPLPFRGQFVRAILAYAGKSWTEHDGGEIQRLMNAGPAKQPVPFMGPPALIDNRSGMAISQMPAIAAHLGEAHNLMGADPLTRIMTIKIANDANDVIDELTLDGGREMWTQASWSAFVPRLQKWMALWEATGGRHNLGEQEGYLLGTPEPSLADIVTATLWGTMGDRFPVLWAMLVQTAPTTARLVERMQTKPALRSLRQSSAVQYGDAYCGGEIEKSLRSVLIIET